MAELNNIPEADDTKTRVTSKITPETPGKSAAAIDLDAQKSDSSTMTRRTLKLQGLAGLAGAAKATEKPAPAPAPAVPKEDKEDTRTRRTLKLSSLASGPSVKAPVINKPAAQSAPAPAPTPAPDKPSGEKLSLKSASSETVTRRTQRLEALDTQDVIAMTEADLNSGAVKMSKPAAPVNNPPPPVPKTRQTVKVEGIAPAHTPAIDLDAKVGDTNTRKTVKLTAPEAAPADIDLDAPAGGDTRTRKSVSMQAPEKLKSNNVDDTVKLQRPAPRPAMPGSVAPPTQGNKTAVGGIKLNKSAAAPKTPAPAPDAAEGDSAAAPVAAPKAAPKSASAAAPKAAPAAAPKAAPKKEKLKVNTDAIKDLGSAPVASDAGAEGMTPVDMLNMNKPARESLVANILFIFFGVLAALLLIFVTMVAVIDHVNIWIKDANSQKVEMPLVSNFTEKAETTVNEAQVFKSPNDPAAAGQTK